MIEEISGDLLLIEEELKFRSFGLKMECSLSRFEWLVLFQRDEPCCHVSQLLAGEHCGKPFWHGGDIESPTMFDLFLSNGGSGASGLG